MTVDNFPEDFSGARKKTRNKGKIRYLECWLLIRVFEKSRKQTC
jgi:hypothetical protein